jgi:hypothetical protein
VLLVILIVICVTKLVLAYLGWEDIRVDTSSPVELLSKDENSLVLSKKLHFYNEGKQCATIMDAICRSQLPYEQYDGIEVRAKAEREGEVREDDYFEAVIIQCKGYKGGEDSLNIYAKVKLTPRKGMSLDEALSHMVDLPLDIIWQETGRMPQHYKKIRITITAEEIAKLAGVQLVKD